MAGSIKKPPDDRVATISRFLWSLVLLQFQILNFGRFWQSVLRVPSCPLW